MSERQDGAEWNKTISFTLSNEKSMSWIVKSGDFDDSHHYSCRTFDRQKSFKTENELSKMSRNQVRAINSHSSKREYLHRMRPYAKVLFCRECGKERETSEHTVLECEGLDVKVNQSLGSQC